MRIPDSLVPLVDYGIVQDVVRPLMSGKEAQIFVVVADGKYCVAKVYKEATQRSFKHRSDYTEGRKVRNSRDQRAIEKRTKHGRAQDEAAWRSTEVDMIRRLHTAGVRVPTPYHFIDGVLIMEIVLDAEGNPAPRLADVPFDAAGAQDMYHRLLGEVQRMLCAGVVHGDLSDFNVLIGADGPVIIDFPQSVDTAHNTNARRLLLRDVDNLHRFLFQFAPHARRLPYAEEMWELFQQNALTPDTKLTGRYRPSERLANTGAVLDLIRDANYDEQKRRQATGQRSTQDLQGATPPPQDYRGPSRGGYESRGPRPPQDARASQPRAQGQDTRGPQRNGPPQDSRGPQRNGAPQDSRSPQHPHHNGSRQDPRGPQRSGPTQDSRVPQRNGSSQDSRGPQRSGPPQDSRGPQRNGPQDSRGPQRNGPPQRGASKPQGSRPVEVIVVRRQTIARSE